jgi:hypothetical protein
VFPPDNDLVDMSPFQAGSALAVEKLGDDPDWGLMDRIVMASALSAHQRGPGGGPTD